MGKASSLGLGLALGRPERQVWVLDGDGSLVMNLGTLVTIAEQQPPNLTHFLLQNGVYEVTGGQPVPGAGRADLAQMARGAGYPLAERFATVAALDEGLEAVLGAPGPRFVTLDVDPAGALPRAPGPPGRLGPQGSGRAAGPPRGVDPLPRAGVGIGEMSAHAVPDQLPPAPPRRRTPSWGPCGTSCAG